MAVIEFRQMTPADIEPVKQIDQRSFSVPWPDHIYQEELSSNQYARYYVVTKGQTVIGFCGTWMVIDEEGFTRTRT